MDDEGQNLGFNPVNRGPAQSNKAYHLLRQQAVEDLRRLNQQHMSSPYGMAPGPRVSPSPVRGGTAPAPSPALQKTH